MYIVYILTEYIDDVDNFCLLANLCYCLKMPFFMQFKNAYLYMYYITIEQCFKKLLLTIHSNNIIYHLSNAYILIFISN